MRIGKPIHSIALLLAAVAQLGLVLHPSAEAWAQNPPPSAAPGFSSDPTTQPRAGGDVAREGIPTEPSAPPSLTPRKAAGVIRCQRRFMYRGKLLDCDSNLDQDGERLRPILKDVPAAVAELDQYQHQKAKIRRLAYAGGVGLGMILAGFLASRLTKNAETSRDFRVMGIGGGGIVIAISLLSGLASLNSTSEHLGNAVKEYNQARPSDPIELQFSTGIEF